MANLVPSGDFTGPQKERSRFDRGDADDETFVRILGEVAETMREASLPHLFMGGIAATAHGRERFTKDVDVFVKPEHADHALERLAERGFEIERTNADWLYKGMKEDVLVDVIFRSSGPIELDDEMVRRARYVEFKGVTLPALSPEDLIVVKAVAFAEETPQHWFDALALIEQDGLDWDYIQKRARVRPLRVLSLLAYALERGLPVPVRIVADGLQGELPNHPGAGQREAEHHVAALVREGLKGEEVEVVSHEGKLVVRGSVPSQERRDAVTQAVDALLGPAGWENRVRVEEYPSAEESERLP